MKAFRFTPLPFSAGQPLPLVPITLAGITEPVVALVDTGAVRNRFDIDLAYEIGLDPSLGSTERFDIGGRRHFGYNFDAVDLELAGWPFQAPVCFVEDWNFSHQILGLQGFLRFFDCDVRASQDELRLEPVA